ncbi:MAG: polyphenol oxidase family protein [Fusobacteriaceae bacterium]|jgi:YfiH family protein|nr:polyphenol oxidase family protein [Fusobacteriaceae bacterium]
MWRDMGWYLESEEFLSLGARAVFTGKAFGDAKSPETTRLRELPGIGEKALCAGHQVHGEQITVVDEPGPLYREDNDGFLTNRDDVVLYTKYADCLPVFLLDPATGAMGVVHSGWKGSFAAVGLSALRLMERRYGSKISDIRILFGIGIAGRNYVVSGDFRGLFAGKFPPAVTGEAFSFREGKIFFDNQTFNRLLFREAGVPSAHIFTNSLCVYDDPRFFSYRREKENPGRNAGIIYRL